MQVQITTYITLEQAQKLKKEDNQAETVRKALDLYYSQKNLGNVNGKQVRKEG